MNGHTHFSVYLIDNDHYGTTCPKNAKEKTVIEQINFRNNVHSEWQTEFIFWRSKTYVVSALKNFTPQSRFPIIKTKVLPKDEWKSKWSWWFNIPEVCLKDAMKNKCQTLRFYKTLTYWEKTVCRFFSYIFNTGFCYLPQFFTLCKFFTTKIIKLATF